MAINPRVAARRAAEIAFLKEEDDRLKDLGEKRKKEAAEKSAATKKEDLPGYDPKKEDDVVLYSEEDRDKGNEYSTFGSDFLEELEKDEPKYLSPADKRKQKTSDSIFNAYNTGEEWLMSDGDDLAKGFINNFRSAIGTGVEDLAFAISDFAPWYKPAQNVVEKNAAGKIAETAQNQFGNAKAKGVNGKVVDFLDNTSKSLGYSLLGFKAGDYAQTIGEGFDTYRNLREQGYSIEDATNKSLISAGVSLAGDKALDKGGKLLGNKVSETLSYHANGKALPAKGWSDKRNRLDKIERRDIIETQAGFACFPDELQNEYAKKIKPEKYMDKGVEKIYFDVAMHGTPQAVGFWSEETNMSPRFLAEIITHNPKYEKGQKVRLLSCSTGAKTGSEYCFAEELANIMGVEVEAPSKDLYMYPNGKTKIGYFNEGEMVTYKPNDRGRFR